MKGFAHRLPEQFHEGIFKFFKDEDKFKALVGKLMLRQFLHERGFNDSKFQDWQSTYYGKPSIHSFPAFNISHSKSMVVCAIAESSNTILGIDTEGAYPIEMEYFKSCFNDNEWNIINRDADPLRCFYRYWTMKESFIKADGRGLSLAPIHVITDGMKAWELGNEVNWYFHSLSLHPLYETHLCLATSKAEIKCREFQLVY